ncbi:MAG: DUF6600 domain-containing protein [Verrucomicrobiia bacterium]|jgi:hypothetical protein
MKTKYFFRQIVGTVTLVVCLLGAGPLLRAQPAAPPPDTAAAPDALPPDILPTSPLAQVIRLMQAGVDESIIMTYVTNSGSTFNLNPDKIIYLKDIGLPTEVVTAMMQRDKQLQQQMTATTYQPPPQPAPVPETTEQPETTPEPPPVEPPTDQPTVVTVNFFYDTLAPYGTWVNVDGYGRCWRPSVVVYNPGWQPYCDHGHWVYTNCGWYWSSDYSWGWAPFHYGRWFLVPRWGWCWMPDTIWGPSWVTWRYSNDYCGWAPLPPFAVYQEGVGFFYNGLAVSVGFDFGLSWNCFTFVPIGHFCDPHPRHYCVAPAQVTQIYNHTTVINNFNGHGHNLANRGIDPEHITAVTHTSIRPIAIRDTAAPSGHGPHDQLSRDGSTLIVSRPSSMNNPSSSGYPNNHSSSSGSPAQNHSPLPNNNWPAAQTQPTRQPYVPVVTTHGPQDGNAVHFPAQHPSSTANYNSEPPSAPAAPNNNGTYSPRGWEQIHPSPSPRPNSYNPVIPAVPPAPGQGQSSAPVQSQPQHNQPAPAPAASSPQKSSDQNQNQSGSGYNSGNGSGYGPRH